MSDCCEQAIEADQLQARQRRVLAIVLAINVGAFVMMVTAAVWSGASSLLSGTLDNFGDALTYALSFAVVGASLAAKAKVALLKGVLISAAALMVAAQIGWRLFNIETPIFEVMGIAAAVNLAANGLCLALLSPHRADDINMMSVWECSRNDVYEGVAVIGAAGAVWLFASAWPDLLIAIALLVLFTKSAYRVLVRAWQDLKVHAQPAT